MGGSGGGGLAAGVALLGRDRGEVPIRAQFFLYPMLDHRTGISAPPADSRGPQRATRCRTRQAAAGWEVTQGKDTLDRKIYNPNPEGVSEQLDKARAIAFHFLKAMGPADFVEQVYNSVTGQPKGDKAVAWARILGPMTGAASISQGVPEGPEAGVQRGVMDRKAYARAQAIPEAKLLVNAGKVDEARALLESRLGNSRDAQMALRPMLNPVRAQVMLNRRFERSATDEDRARAAGVTGGRGGILSLMP